MKTTKAHLFPNIENAKMFSKIPPNKKKKMANPKIKIDAKKIGAILKSLDGAEYLFMKHCMVMRDNINVLIEKHGLTKEDVCEKFRINPSEYNNYLKGNYNYSVKDMACLDATFMELESKKLKEKVPVKIG
jgi:hypothetical protein